MCVVIYAYTVYHAIIVTYHVFLYFSDNVMLFISLGIVMLYIYIPYIVDMSHFCQKCFVMLFIALVCCYVVYNRIVSCCLHRYFVILFRCFVMFIVPVFYHVVWMLCHVVYCTGILSCLHWYFVMLFRLRKEKIQYKEDLKVRRVA